MLTKSLIVNIIKDRTSVETVKEKFYTDFTEQFLCSYWTCYSNSWSRKEQDTLLNLDHHCMNNP